VTNDLEGDDGLYVVFSPDLAMHNRAAMDGSWLNDNLPNRRKYSEASYMSKCHQVASNWMVL
jgi:hypothetical protein